jgi:hypothetical protein
MVVHEEPPFVEYSHLTTLPVLLVKLRVAPLEPEQTVAFEFTVPPTETGFTVIVTEVEFAEVQTPLWTNALPNVVCVRLLNDCEVVVFTISVQFVPPSTEYCHFKTFPVCPVKLTVPLLVPEQTVELLPTEPPIDNGLTVMVAALDSLVAT